MHSKMGNLHKFYTKIYVSLFKQIFVVKVNGSDCREIKNRSVESCACHVVSSKNCLLWIVMYKCVFLSKDVSCRRIYSFSWIFYYFSNLKSWNGQLWTLPDKILFDLVALPHKRISNLFFHHENIVKYILPWRRDNSSAKRFEPLRYKQSEILKTYTTKSKNVPS